MRAGLSLYSPLGCKHVMGWDKEYTKNLYLPSELGTVGFTRVTCYQQQFVVIFDAYA